MVGNDSDIVRERRRDVKKKSEEQIDSFRVVCIYREIYRNTSMKIKRQENI